MLFNSPGFALFLPVVFILYWFAAKRDLKLQKIPYRAICHDPYVLTSNWAPAFESADTVNYSFLSPVSIEYLNKIRQLSITHKFKLILLPVPTSLAKKTDVEKMNKNEIVKAKLGTEFENYFKSIIYYNDSNFIDGFHLKRPGEFKIL